MKLTKGVKHFVALVKNEVFDVFEIEGLSTNQSQNTSGCTDNNVWAVLLQNFLVLFNWHTTEEDGNLKISGKTAKKKFLFKLPSWNPCILRIARTLSKFGRPIHECGT